MMASLRWCILLLWAKMACAFAPVHSSYRIIHSTDSSLTRHYVSSVDAISISDTYDSGNGKFLSAKIINEVDNDCDIAVNVEIRPDPYTELEKKQHFQYFSFRSSINLSSPSIKGIFSNKETIKVKYILQNAGEASYADAFNGYSTFVTTRATPFDPESWTRTNNCSYENGCLTWTHVHDLRSTDKMSAYFAYFPPYSYERHLGLVAKCAGENDSSS